MTRFFILIIILSISFSSCKRSKLETDTEQDILNSQFYELMEYAYFWNYEMPTIDPTTYNDQYEVLEAVRYDSLDRWSFIMTYEEYQQAFENAETTGHGLGYIWNSTETKLYVAFIFKASDLYKSGVRRGWEVLKINDKLLSEYTSGDNILAANTNVFTFKDFNDSEVVLTDTKSDIQMNTVMHSEVINGNKKVGYIVFDSFLEASINELNVAFDDFKSNGIEELIVDLRYNGGGVVDVSAYFAGLIHTPSDTSQVFAKYIFNDEFAEAEQNSDPHVYIKSALTNSLDLDKVTFIMTKNSASASELLANGLKPYIDVTLVGSTSHGKPMGMNGWFDNGNDPAYVYYPITFKTINADGEGDYFDGLSVDYTASDGVGCEWGSLNDPSFKAALNYAMTGTFTSQITSQSTTKPKTALSNSLFFDGVRPSGSISKIYKK